MNAGMTDKPKWEREPPVRRECYALYLEHGVATVWTVYCVDTCGAEEWIRWQWDATAGEFCAEGVGRSREEAEGLAKRMLEALVAMASQYTAPRDLDEPPAPALVDAQGFPVGPSDDELDAEMAKL